MAATRITVSVRLRERQLTETILALEAVDLTRRDASGAVAIQSALLLFRVALARLQERTS